MKYEKGFIDSRGEFTAITTVFRFPARPKARTRKRQTPGQVLKFRPVGVSTRHRGGKQRTPPLTKFE
jgi:hypothetical protein